VAILLLKSRERKNNMSKLKDMIQDAPVHERRLEFRSYPLKDGGLIVEGWLRDEQLVPGYYWDGESRPIGTIHLLGVRMLVSGWPLHILDAEAEMHDVPHSQCPTTEESVKKIVGLSIVSGYSEEVRARIGGVRGCTHLTHLITAMGTAALHGYWVQRSRSPRPIPKSMGEFPELAAVRDSCMLWSEDGPLMQHVRDTIKRSGEGKKDIES
jgi:hypothetical protein